jgi:hypothetical protein
MTTATPIIIASAPLWNFVLGSFVISLLDHEDMRYSYWLRENPLQQLGFILCLEIWPLFAFVMIKDRIEARRATTSSASATPPARPPE